MNRTEKSAEIEELKTRFAQSQLTVLTDYKGLSVASITELRHKLSASKSRLKIVKNRLAKIAVKDTSLEPLQAQFAGTTAVVTTAEDVAAQAKVVVDFAKDNELFKIKMGVLSGKMIDLKGLQALAKLPSKEQLIAMLLGSLKAPASNLASVLAQIPRQLVNVLDAVKRQKELQA